MEGGKAKGIWRGGGRESESSVGVKRLASIGDLGLRVGKTLRLALLAQGYFSPARMDWKKIRPEPDSNRRMMVLQTIALANLAIGPRGDYNFERSLHRERFFLSRYTSSIISFVRNTPGSTSLKLVVPIFWAVQLWAISSPAHFFFGRYTVGIISLVENWAGLA